MAKKDQIHDGNREFIKALTERVTSTHALFTELGGNAVMRNALAYHKRGPELMGLS